MNGMTDENSKTLEAYESKFVEYVTVTIDTVQGSMKEWLDAAVKGLPFDAEILEIGSGSGRDAKYLQSQGYAVHCSDVPKGFLAILEAQGFDTQQLNIVTDEIKGSYDLVLANAVLLHFTDDDMHNVLRKIYASLHPNGRLAFSLMKGKGSRWTDNKIDAPRYFNYWEQDELEKLLRKIGFKNVDIQIATNSKGVEWLMVVTSK